MKKLLALHDKYTLKILVSFLIVFIALYPKLPSVHIIRTWVYIRLEDFCILGTSIIWFIQLLRKKAAISIPLGIPILAYWLVGLIATIISVLFIGPHLANFFSHVEILEYLRRIEYMILFFVAYSTVQSTKDLRDYFVILSVTIFCAFIYGLGQRYYLDIWAMYPKFFQSYPFCFPSFQTGNEQFAKGIPLCLPPDARITSTFGGNYDLSGYLVFVMPIIVGVYVTLKKWYWQILTALLFICSLVLLNFTSSRTSFSAYLVGAIFTLVIFKKKFYIIPLLVISAIVLLSFSGTTAKRFLSTFRFSTVVTTNQGQLVGELPQNLQNKVSKNSEFEAPPPAQNLPEGSAIIGLPSSKTHVSTNEAVITTTLSAAEARKLGLANGSLEISTVSGTFLVKKALVYDISLTTRFQAEWPNAWQAFMREPLFGSGFSTISLATDGDYLRFLGESGIFGLVSFIFIFIIFGITLKESLPGIKDPLTRGIVIGLAGGVIGLSVNAFLIDIFESSKVAETLWLLLGIGAGGISISKPKAFSYFAELKKVLTSNFVIAIYLLFIFSVTLISAVSNFFVADDFTWLRWAANSTLSDVFQYFTNANGFFYRPLAKTFTFLMYSVFAFQPAGYHVLILIIGALTAIGMFLLANSILKNKKLAFLLSMVFIVLPSHAENNYWYSTLSGSLASLFIIYTLLAYYHFRLKHWVINYVLAFLLSVFAFLSYEIAVIIPLLLLALDIILIRPKRSLLLYASYIPFILLIPFYFVVRHLTHAFSGGGDYSYSIPHLIPNIIGNLFGYLGLFLIGEPFLSMYANLRAVMREQPLLFSLSCLTFLLAIIIFLWAIRTKILKSFKQSKVRIFIFGIVFAIISLVPFLGLGNIAERYLYLASFGFCISLILFLEYVIDTTSMSRSYKNTVLIVFVCLLSLFYQWQNIGIQSEWAVAGTITKNMLSYFRINYTGFVTTDNLYFVNTPMTYKYAWVFPDGLSDSLWFIYQDDTPQVHEVSSISQAKKEIGSNILLNNYIFMFNNNGTVVPVK